MRNLVEVRVRNNSRKLTVQVNVEFSQNNTVLTVKIADVARDN